MIAPLRSDRILPQTDVTQNQQRLARIRKASNTRIPPDTASQMQAQ